MVKDHRRWYCFLAFQIFLTAALVSGEIASNWPCQRGPSHDGNISPTNFDFSWPKTGPPVLWKVHIGEGYSGLIVADERVFTQEQTRGGQFVVCLDLNDGQQVWQSRYDYPWQVGSAYPGPYATPTYSEGQIFFADCYGFAGCMDAKQGNIRWTVNFTAQFKGQGTDFGYACSPLVEDGRVFLPVGGKAASVVALSAKDGSVLWKTGDDPASYSSSFPIEVQGHRQIVSFMQNVLVAHDPATGAELWRDRWSMDGYDEHSTEPLYQEPFLFCAAPFRRGARVLKLSYEGGRAKTELAWKNSLMCNDVFSSVLVNGYVYGSDVLEGQANHQKSTRSDFKCLELATGRECWVSKATGHAHVLSCGDKLILLNEAGELVVVSATPDAYHELARASLLEGERPFWTEPAVCQGRLLVRNHQNLICYQIASNAQTGVTLATADNKATASVSGKLRPIKAWLDEGQSWLDSRQNSDLAAPSLAQLARWYGYCLGLLALSGGVMWRWRKRPGNLILFAAVNLVLGAVAFPVFSAWTGRVIFTWPVACHAAFIVLLASKDDTTGNAISKIKRVAPLVLFVLFCLGYYLACRQLFILQGVGFLVGFLPALPVTRWFVRLGFEKARAERIITAGALSFSLYYWGSALQILWRTTR